MFTLSLALASTGLLFAGNVEAIEVGSVNSDAAVRNGLLMEPASFIGSQSKFVEATRLSELMKAPAASDLTLDYALPVQVYTSRIYTTRPDGTRSFFPGSVFVPPFIDVTYKNLSYYVEGGVAVTANEGYNYTWTNSYREEIPAYDYTQFATPYAYAEYSLYSPSLKVDGGDSFDMTWVWNEKDQGRLAVKVGGNGAGALDLYREANPTYSDFAGLSVPYAATVPDFYDEIWAGVFTQNEYSRWNGITEKEYTAMNGLYQIFPYAGVPYTLSAAQIKTLFNGEAGAKLNVAFWTLDAEGKKVKKLAEVNHTFEEGTPVDDSGYYRYINVAFESEDAFGDILEYVVVDSDIMMEVTGFEDSHFRTISLPLACYNCYGTNRYDTENIGAILTDDNGDVDYVPNGWSWSQGSIQGVSFEVALGVYYPFVQIDAVAEQGQASWTELDASQREFTINLTADKYQLFEVLSNADPEDVMIETMDGGDIPEWLVVEASKDLIGASAGHEEDTKDFFGLVLMVADGAQRGGCELKLSYMGYSNIIKINPELSGIEGVVDNGVETVASEYYDLQGRKLYNEPANGLFIRKDIKADGSVKSVKVVK